MTCSLFFFFSSRRRHTRFDCDWSSDVCSSDLVVVADRPSAQGDERRAGSHRCRVLDEGADEGGPQRRGRPENPLARVVALKPADKMSDAVEHTLGDEEAEGGADDELSHAHD